VRKCRDIALRAQQKSLLRGSFLIVIILTASACLVRFFVSPGPGGAQMMRGETFRWEGECPHEPRSVVRS
jgi:hypothetical protein